MKRQSIERLVYECMIPRPKASDPYNFNGILTRFLVFEVRQEVHSFYGHLDTQEAKYPGLDYVHPVHRIRLSRWPWHRRLFRAFDTLRLTPAEIASLTKWEGTKWAKERYEKEQKMTIHDTAADDMPDYRAPGSRLAVAHGTDIYNTVAYGTPSSASYDEKEEMSGQAPTDPALLLHLFENRRRVRLSDVLDGDEIMADGGQHNEEIADNNQDSSILVEDDDSDDGEIQSIGLQLNERLRERVAAHNAGDTSQPLDEDWEQWLKNAIEAGNLNMVAEHISRLASMPISQQPPAALSSGSGARSSANARQTNADIIPPNILNAAQEGNWESVPNFVQEVFRQRAEAEASRSAIAGPTSSPSSSGNIDTHQRTGSSSWRRTYSDLRLPGQ